MKLIFINIYPDETIARYLLSSYVLSAYIKEYYPKKDFLEIKILNFSNNVNPQRIIESIQKEEPDFISYSCYVWNINTIIGIAKEIENSLSCVQIFGGPDITLEKIENSMNFFKGRAYFVIGEGERKLLHLLEFLSFGNSDLEFPRGIAYWKDNGISFTSDTDLIRNLDEIPSVYLNNHIEERLYAHQQAFLETQRGCRFRCKYCVYHKHNSGMAYYSQQRIFDELDFLLLTKKITALRIFDSIFTSDLPRAKNIIRHLIELKKKQNSLPWIYWEFTFNSIDGEFLSLVSELKTKAQIKNSNTITALDRPQHYSDMLEGYTSINCIGIQSFSNAAQKAVSRPKINKEKFREFMGQVFQYNVVLKIDIILGLPFESERSYFEGLEYLIGYLKDTDHILNIHRLQMLPGSDLEKSVTDFDIEYSRQAPYYVLSTGTFSCSEMKHAARLTAILFRMINSPLRSKFFSWKEKRTESLQELLDVIFSKLSQIPEIHTAQLFQSDWVDDNYWNNKIFSEIPSQLLISVLDQMTEK